MRSIKETKDKKYYFVAAGHRLSKNYEFRHEAQEEFCYMVNEELCKIREEQRVVAMYCSSDVNSDFNFNTVDTWYPGDTIG